MKIILFIFSFVLLVLAYSTFKASGAIPRSVINWNWFGAQSISLDMDYRVLGLGFLISLPILLLLFRKRS
jgi:hypothetical protein